MRENNRDHTHVTEKVNPKMASNEYSKIQFKKMF